MMSFDALVPAPLRSGLASEAQLFQFVLMGSFAIPFTPSVYKSSKCARCLNTLYLASISG